MNQQQTLKPEHRYYWLFYSLKLVLFAIPAVAYLHANGGLAAYFEYDVLDGQFLYMLSKFNGLYALMFLWLQIVYGLLDKQYRWMLTVSESRSFHRNNGLWVVVLLLTHIGLFVAAVSARKEHFDFSLLLPNFNGYYHSMLTLGLIGFFVVLISIPGRLLRNIYSDVGNWLHRLSIISFILIYFHSYAIGSESRVGAMGYLLNIMLASVGILLALKLYNDWLRPVTRKMVK